MRPVPMLWGVLGRCDCFRDEVLGYFGMEYLWGGAGSSNGHVLTFS